MPIFQLLPQQYIAITGEKLRCIHRKKQSFTEPHTDTTRNSHVTHGIYSTHTLHTHGIYNTYATHNGASIINLCNLHKTLDTHLITLGGNHNYPIDSTTFFHFKKVLT